MIQIYTGDGKGKTTCAVGLAVRASAHYRVLFTQFIKKGDSSEVDVLEKMSNIDFMSFGQGNWIIKNGDKKKEKKNINKGYDYLRENYDNYDVVIMDEAVTAVGLGIIKDTEIMALAREIGKDKEIILTGRGATKSMIEKADLVTEMKKIKHYYDKGVSARKGIEL